jgi:hypothetical protein
MDLLDLLALGSVAAIAVALFMVALPLGLLASGAFGLLFVGNAIARRKKAAADE